jgi:hypothetical protein
MIMIKRLFREPLVHFLLLSAGILAVYGLLNRGEIGASDRIVITAPTIEQLASVFAKTWQRPPSRDELKALIDEYVKEEIYYREARKIGLDIGDTVIRRRLRQKFEFLTAASVDDLTPTDADLETYLQAHLEDFETEAMLAFEQIFLNPQIRGERLAKDAASILETLLTGPVADTSMLGDATTLPSELHVTSKSSIASMFGAAFADAVDKLPQQRWAGPVKSEFGLHLVRVSKREAGRRPVLDEVRAEVRRDWTNLQRRLREDQRLKDLLTKYPVEIEAGAQESKP